ncbi:DUF6392 family protein [Pseudomonas sp. XS1P51]
MDAITIGRWIKGLGQSYRALVESSVIPNMPLQELYSGRDWLDISPVPGVEFSFWAETSRLEKVFVTCMETMPGITIYEGGMPEPYEKLITQSDVHALFGEPMESEAPSKCPNRWVKPADGNPIPLIRQFIPARKLYFNTPLRWK